MRNFILIKIKYNILLVVPALKKNLLYRLLLKKFMINTKSIASKLRL